MLLTLFVRKQAGWWAFAAGLMLWTVGRCGGEEGGAVGGPFAFVLLFCAWLTCVQKPGGWLQAVQGVLEQKRLWIALLGTAAVTASTWITQKKRSSGPT